MIGILIVTHCELGSALLEATEFIIGSRPEDTEPVSIDLNENAEKLRKKKYQTVSKRSTKMKGC